MDEADRHALGMQTRRAVLGDAYFNQAIAGSTAITAEFQDLIVRYAWVEIWTRPLIDRATRRLLTLAMTIALGRDEEFRLHVRAALDAGIDAQLIKEVVLQSAIYCGVPAANSAFASLKRVMAQSTDPSPSE